MRGPPNVVMELVLQQNKFFTKEDHKQHPDALLPRGLFVYRKCFVLSEINHAVQLQFAGDANKCFILSTGLHYFPKFNVHVISRVEMDSMVGRDRFRVRKLGFSTN